VVVNYVSAHMLIAHAHTHNSNVTLLYCFSRHIFFSYHSSALRANSGKIAQSELRIRENLCNTLTRKFLDEMKEYQRAQQKFKRDIKNKVKRQVQIVKPEATEEEIEQVMKSEGGRDQLYKDKILKVRCWTICCCCDVV